MKLNPQQAPLYGECVLTVQLNKEEYVEDEEDVEFYLLFAGTTQRHLTTTLRVSHVTLQAVCPAHDRGETVQVTLCLARPGGSVDAVAEERFQYVQDLALDMAHFLLSASGQRDGLERALLLDECQIPLQECERLDETLALALRHIPLPPGWSVLGTDINTNSHTDLGPQETLLHFAARRGLRRVALFLLQQPGGRDALRHQNKQGHTPAGVAQKRGHIQLQHLLSELEDSPCYETKPARRRVPGGRAFLHHPKLNTYTLTVDGETDVFPPDLRADVVELQRFIQSHQQEKGRCLIEQEPVSLILSRDICDGSQKATITSCPGPPLQNPAEHQEAEAERENGELLNGTKDYIQSEELEEAEPDSAGEGVCVEGREECAAVSGASCGERQQEEADRAVGVIAAEQKEHFSSKTYKKAKSGNPEAAGMGQSQGLLPSGAQQSEEGSRRRDLPEEREGDTSSGQEAARSSTLWEDVPEEGDHRDGERRADGYCYEGASPGSFGTNQALVTQETPYLGTERVSVVKESGEVKEESCSEGTEAGTTNSRVSFEAHLEVNASQTSEETVVSSETGCVPASSPKKDTGNHSVKTQAGQDEGFSESTSGLISLRPNMAPGPIHNVRHESPPIPDCGNSEEMVIDTSGTLDPHQQTGQTAVAPVEGASVCSGQVSSDLCSNPTDKEEPSEGPAAVPHENTSEAATVSSPAEEGGREMAAAEAPLESEDEKRAEESSNTETPAGSDEHPVLDLLPVDTSNEAEILSGGSDSSPSDLTAVGESSSPPSDKAPGEPLPEGGPDAPPVAEAGLPETLPREGEGASSSDEAAGDTLPGVGENGPPPPPVGVSEDATLPAEVGVVETSKEGGDGSPAHEAVDSSPPAAAGETSPPPAETEETSKGHEDASPSVTAGAGDTSPKASDEASAGETSSVASLAEPQNENELVMDTRDQALAVVVPPPQLTEPEEVPCSSSGSTVPNAGICETVSGESNETIEERVALNEGNVRSDMASDGPSTPPCDPTSKESSSAVSPGPQSEVVTSGAEGQASPAPLLVSSAASVESSSGLSLDITSISDTVSASTQPVGTLEKDRGTVLGLDTCSPLEVDSGLSHGLPPSDTGDSLGGVDEERNQPEEELEEEQVEDDHSGSADVQASLTDMDQTEIHRDTEVFYPLDACTNTEEPQEPSGAGNPGPDGSEGVCRSESVSSLPESESVSDGDSLLSTEAADDSVFKQNEDTVTLAADSTSGISITGSSSTDDSSSLGPCSSELQPVEGALMGCADQPAEGALMGCADQPAEDSVKVGSDQALEGNVKEGSSQSLMGDAMVDSVQPVEGTVTEGSSQPVEGTVTEGSSQPVEGTVTEGSSQPVEGTVKEGSSQPVEGTVTEGSCQPVEGTVTEGSSQPVEGTVTEGSSQPVEGTVTEGSSQPVEGTVTEGSTQPVEGTVTEGSTQPVEGTVTEGSSQPVEGIITEGSSQPVEGTITESSSQPVEGTVTEGSTQPVEGTVTEGSSQPVEGIITEGSSQPVEGTITESSNQPEEGTVTGGFSQPVDSTIVVGSSLVVEGTVTVGSDQPVENTAKVCSDSPVEGTVRVGSNQPVEDTATMGSRPPVEGTGVVDSGKPVEGTVVVGSDQPAEGTATVHSDQPGGASSPTTGEPEEEEKKDQLTEVPERSTLLRSSARSLSPSRRHSWGPTRNSTGEADMGQRSMSWCPSDVPRPETDEMNARSYSLEGLAEGDVGKCSSPRRAESQREPGRPGRLDSEERGSLVSLTEEEQESDMGDASSLDSQRSVQTGRHCAPPPPQTLTKSISMSAISPRDLDVIGRARPKRRISFSFSVSPILPKSKTLFAVGSSSSEDEEAANLGSYTSASGSLEYSISEEDPAPLRSETGEVRVGGTKVSRTFSYLKSKMSKKSKEKDKEKSKDGKEKEKRSSSGHLFSSVSTAPPSACLQCSKPINAKDALQCSNCSAHVHKACKEGLPVCAKVKMKQQQQTVPDSASAHAVAVRSKSATGRERPWSTAFVPDDQMPPPPIPPPRKSPGLMAFSSNTLSKSISISNIAGQMDDAPLKALKFLSQSTDSLHKISKVNESTESLTDEGTELMDGQLMGDFEADAKELEADSWSATAEKKYLKQLKKDVIKRQDVIFELIQTEMHHVRTLRIMADVYSKSLQNEVQLGSETVDKMFPMLEELLDLHTLFLTHLLERKRAAQAKRVDEGGYAIRRIGDVLLNQVTGANAERMTKVYGKFCSRHHEAVNLYKELLAKDKRFQAVVRKIMSSPVVRRLSIPECVLLVTQRITKYPVLLQRILQHTKDPEEEQKDMTEALQQMKEVIAAVDLKVSEYEKRRRLKEIHSRTDSKSIMRMRSGQMFAREDLIRGRRLIHDGPLQLKSATGRLKDVQALLLSDMFVFLQEKDQKYVFASLDQRSTVISLHKLIVREVANEERGLFLITVGMDQPEMVEVYASSKVERNTWIQLIQNAMQSTEREDDEGIPSENEEDKKLQEIKAKEMRDQLQKKDEQIVCLLEEKVRLFRELCEVGPVDDAALRSRMMFRATSDEVTKGEPIIKDALKEVEKLQELVNGSVFGAVGQQVCAAQESAGVSLPRRAETFGGFDSHQMNSSKSRDGEREELDESVELRRTESDGVLKKGGNANLLLLLKRNSEQVLQSVTHLHDLLNTLQAVVVQQDSFIEDQRQALLSDRPSTRHPSVSSSSSSSSTSSRPASLIEQEKQRSAERQRQEAEERRRREKEWEQKEKEVQQREERLQAVEEENARSRKELDEERKELQSKKEEYQRDLARLRDSQKRLEREREQLYTQTQLRQSTEDLQLQQRQRTSSSASEDSLKLQSSGALAESGERSTSLPTLGQRKSKNLNPFSSGSSQKGGAAEPQSQIPSRLLNLAKPKEKEKKKKKKGKGQQSQNTEAQGDAVPGPADGTVFYC